MPENEAGPDAFPIDPVVVTDMIAAQRDEANNRAAQWQAAAEHQRKMVSDLSRRVVELEEKLESLEKGGNNNG